jgi:adenylate kinase family enzyme
MLSFSDIYWFFKGLKVYALVGESGTGKSFRAKLLAQKYGIELIIDDGLLIRGDKILAGHSAKREQTFLAAVRVALFDDKIHRDTIARELQNQTFKKVLILGTSEKMVNKIAARLQLPQPQKIIRIEDIATKEEIEYAIRSRRVEGKHVIPVPSIEIQRSYPQIFYDRVRVLLKRNQNPLAGSNYSKVYEKSVVRPEFSRTGRKSISEATLCRFVMKGVSEFDGQIRIKKMAVKPDEHGYKLVIVIDVPFGTQLTEKIHKMQEYIVDTIERNAGILIEDIHIIIDKITPNEEMVK